MNTRANLVFIALLVGQLVLLTSQNRDPESGTSSLERGTVRVVAPFAHAVSRIADGGRFVASRFESVSELQQRQKELEKQLLELRLGNARYQGLEEQVERLADALGYKAPFDGQLRLADVVYIDHASWLRTLLIYEPGRLAVEDSPVTAEDGLVGRVILRDGAYAKVQLITDRASGIGAMVERTRRQGIVRGAGTDGLTLDFMPLQADIQIGDRVVTAGIDGLYPRGLPIGSVSEIDNSGELFHSIRLSPAVDFGVLDQVFVLLRDSIPGGLKGTTSASP